MILEGEVDTGGSLLAEPLHRLQQSQPVRLLQHTYGVQVWLAYLLAYLEVVVAVVEERLRVLPEVEAPQPLHDYVARRRHYYYYHLHLLLSLAGGKEPGIFIFLVFY